MRRYLVAFTLSLLIPSAAAAQDYAIDRGSMVLGGSVSWSSSGGELYENADGDRVNSLLLNPQVMYFVTPGFALGGDLLVERVSQGEFDATTIAVGPAASYFFGGPESSIYPFVGATVGYASTSSSGADASGIAFGGAAGAAFMLSRSVALTGAATYRVQNLSVDQVDESFTGNAFALQIGVEAFLF